MAYGYLHDGYTSSVVHHFVVREWLLHLASLEHLLDTEPGGPTWLWRIRVRILKYMVARYGGEPTQQIERALERLEETEPDELHAPASAAPLPAHLRPTTVEHPPKSVSTLTPILDDIQLVNERCNRANSSWAYPEAAWTWWRDEWMGEGTKEGTKGQRD